MIDDLQSTATRLWPENYEMQQKWVRAVTHLRSTKRGWIFDTLTREQVMALKAKETSTVPVPRFADRVTPISKGKR